MLCLEEHFEPRSKGRSACDCDSNPSEAGKTQWCWEFRILDRRLRRRHPRDRRCPLRNSTRDKADDRPLRRPRMNRTPRIGLRWLQTTGRTWKLSCNSLTSLRTVEESAPRHRHPLARLDPTRQADSEGQACVRPCSVGARGQQARSATPFRQRTGSGHVGHLAGNLGRES